MSAAADALDIADWRRRVFALYAQVRECSAHDPREAHALWQATRDELFASHPASPVPASERASFTGLPVAAYDPAWRFETEVVAPDAEQRLDIPTGTDGVVPFHLLGRVVTPGAGSLDVWRIASYGGGVFVPVKDGLAGTPGGTYGGGRYLLDTIKGADLGRGGAPGSIVVDFNFAYNPSCAYDPAWACPLAPPGNVVHAEITVGERYSGSH